MNYEGVRIHNFSTMFKNSFSNVRRNKVIKNKPLLIFNLYEIIIQMIPVAKRRNYILKSSQLYVDLGKRFDSAPIIRTASILIGAESNLFLGLTQNTTAKLFLNTTQHMSIVLSVLQLV